MALEDKLDQVKGAVKENAGKLTDDKQMQAEGAVENTVAKVKDAATVFSTTPSACICLSSANLPTFSFTAPLT